MASHLFVYPIIIILFLSMTPSSSFNMSLYDKSYFDCNRDQDGQVNPVRPMLVELYYDYTLDQDSQIGDYQFNLRRCFDDKCKTISETWPTCGSGCGDSNHANEWNGFFELIDDRDRNRIIVKIEIKDTHFDGNPDIAFKMVMKKGNSAEPIISQPFTVTDEENKKCSGIEPPTTPQAMLSTTVPTPTASTPNPFIAKAGGSGLELSSSLALALVLLYIQLLM
jgi:RNA polymerase subunit RPABC4/transcription elongation factor Spt4